MSKFNSPLNNIRVASPCPADWAQMYGDSRKRFCGDCKLNVYNLSGMTTEEAEALIMNVEGRLCVRFYQRRDGTVITQDCPVGWARVKQRTRLYAAAVASLVIALFTGVLFAALFSKQKPLIGELRIPFISPTPTPEHTMGVMALPPVQGKPTMGNIAVPSNDRKQKFESGKQKALVGDEKRRDS
jgi:hypothetical protein